MNRDDSNGWASLQDKYKNNGIALFVGAGVSYGSSIPTWTELVRRLLGAAEKTGAHDGFQSLRDAGFSLPAITEYVKIRGFPDRRDFLEAVREALYRDFPCKDVLKAHSQDGAAKITTHIGSKNKTLAAVYDLAVRKDHAGKLSPNPRVSCIVSFNLDSVLEAYDAARNSLDQTGGKRCLHTIENTGSAKIFGRTNVYHPHGFLRFDRRQGDPRKEATTTVLSEIEYYDFYNRPTTLFTYTTLSLLREFSCLFIGMSMTDDNVRRLLFYSKQERDEGRQRSDRPPDPAPRHHAILRRGGVAEDFLTKTLRGLSVEPLWIDDFDEIPQQLAGCMKCQGGSG